MNFATVFTRGEAMPLVDNKKATTPRARLVEIIQSRGMQPIPRANIATYKLAVLEAGRTKGRMPSWITIDYSQLDSYQATYGFAPIPAELAGLVGAVETELGGDVRTKLDVFDRDPVLHFEVKDDSGAWTRSRENIYATVWGEDPRFAHLLRPSGKGGAVN